ncbi:hypothetical protein B0J12DRAFT_693769 [Macrophomina phaseolina]|uniref:Uncharacterized protein n=1 Tax=Macrophomina phaseolina TaxID=35725 RepID=A0ABQ8GYZ8_9PEZI|nr:hypothetical protein B0J12DRAFT_693769 [Macrophomina phaseolina]
MHAITTGFKGFRKSIHARRMLQDAAGQRKGRDQGPGQAEINFLFGNRTLDPLSFFRPSGPAPFVAPLPSSCTISRPRFSFPPATQCRQGCSRLPCLFGLLCSSSRRADWDCCAVQGRCNAFSAAAHDHRHLGAASSKGPALRVTASGPSREEKARQLSARNSASPPTQGRAVHNAISQPQPQPAGGKRANRRAISVHRAVLANGTLYRVPGNGGVCGYSGTGDTRGLLFSQATAGGATPLLCSNTAHGIFERAIEDSGKSGDDRLVVASCRRSGHLCSRLDRSLSAAFPLRTMHAIFAAARPRSSPIGFPHWAALPRARRVPAAPKRVLEGRDSAALSTRRAGTRPQRRFFSRVEARWC